MCLETDGFEGGGEGGKGTRTTLIGYRLCARGLVCSVSLDPHNNAVGWISTLYPSDS